MAERTASRIALVRVLVRVSSHQTFWMGAHHMFRSFLAAGAATLALTTAMPAIAQAPAEGNAALSAPEIEFTEWTLDNGLRVIAIEDAGTAQVTTSLWYEVGSKHDPEGRSGFAHLFEHILSRKTENMPYNMIYGLTADVGGTRNASTGSDRTNYYETVPAQYLETMLWTHRERMFKPVIDQDVFDKERDVVKEELRQRVLAPPYGRFARFVLPENTYDVLPQRRPGIGSIEELDSATLDDARAFHQAYYGPDTATLIVAGNFEMADLRALVGEYFGDRSTLPSPRASRRAPVRAASSPPRPMCRCRSPVHCGRRPSRAIPMPLRSRYSPRSWRAARTAVCMIRWSAAARLSISRCSIPKAKRAAASPASRSPIRRPMSTRSTPSSKPSSSASAASR